MELSTILIGGKVTVSRGMRLMDRMTPLLPVPEMGHGQTAFQIATVRWLCSQTQKNNKIIKEYQMSMSFSRRVVACVPKGKEDYTHYV